MAAAHVRDVIVATAQQAAKAEMVQGGWKYESINLGWTKGWETERFAERVMERMVSSATSSGDRSMTVDFTKYSITTARLEPAATLAFAATQSQDPTMSLVAASFAELVRQINMDVARPEDHAGEGGRGIKSNERLR
ncbi:uncharacterized protein [Miscanthus floridulus]|uniref:uncharacterized protein n=1 Tax=Miscanthus floridulus TaxID=154761 RepID=UPI00345AEB92